jgi:2-oxoglutarate ferredoxin oxidoreductase subunit beta
MSTATSLPTLTAKDLASDQEIRWCPGCGDYSILAQMKKALTGVGVAREKMVFISGIGCSSRFPYYMNTYGFHTIHGRAPAIATGLKISRPDLQVWVVTGDGDGLSIGGNHLIHAIRRNVDLKIHHLTETLKRAAAHRGTAFIEIYQNCKIFNDAVFEYATDKSVKAENTLYLEHGKPLIFGKDRNKGIRLNGLDPEVVTVGNGISVDDLLIHDEKAEEPSLAYLLSRMVHPEFPECVGVYRAVERPTFDDVLNKQIEDAIRAKGRGKLEDLFRNDDTWEVK